ncbi:MAG TPA: carboxylate--amine ligase [Candidatus Competibacteraceae bacterium]|nr:carboxylate--amine ligase [Candidatus Competibacteraceae bacterium]
MTLDISADVALLGIDTPIGLAIIRELGQANIQVHGIGHSHRSLGRFSRYLTSVHIRPESDEALVSLVHRLQTAKPLYLMAISEGDIQRINRLREALTPVKCLVPSSSAMTSVLDKTQTLSAAQAIGIATPRTWSPTSIDDPTLWTDPQLRFPVILKWADPNQVVSKLQAINAPLRKLEYCLNEQELRHALQRYEAIGQLPLVQNYCPGYGLGQFFFMKDGQALLTFQHRRLHEWPPEGGFSTLCEGLSPETHRPLQEQSIALLRHLGWEGPAMVEYRFDPATGDARLMEINGRFWGSLPLAFYSGAPFALYTYAVLGNGDVPPLAYPRAGLRCRFGIPETKRLLRILFQGQRIPDPTLRFNAGVEVFNYFAGFFDPRMRYFVWSWRDPLPFFADIWNALATSLLKRLTRR